MNSLGLYDASTDLQLAWGSFTPGAIAVVSQSGQLGSEIANLAARSGLGISRFVSIGNQSDVTAAETLLDLVDHGATKVVALYLESFTDGRAIVDAIDMLRAAGKYTLALTVGASEASTRLARSHTGSLTPSTDIVDAAVRAAGAIRVATPTQLVHLANLILTTRMPSGNRVAIVGDSGGQTGIAADVADRAGLQVPRFSEALQSALRRHLPSAAATNNPVDLAGAGEEDLTNYARIVETLAASTEVDAVLLTGYFGSYGDDIPSLAAAELDVVNTLGDVPAITGTPLLVHSMAEPNAASTAMRSRGVPVYGCVEAALQALADTHRLVRSGRALPYCDPRTEPIEPGYLGAQRMLAQSGIGFPRNVRVCSDNDLAAVADLMPPYVLKADWIEHKSEARAVQLGIPDVAQLAAAYADMVARLGGGDYVVEEQHRRPHTVEMIIGGRRDPSLGPVVMVGAGGTEAELYRDVATELAPVDRTTAHAMLDRLMCAPLLHGWRGRPPVDIEAVTTAIVAVSELVAALQNVSEIEVNPVLAGPDGLVAVDALIIASDNTSRKAQP